MLECSYRSSYSCKSYSCASWSCNLYIAYGSQDCPLQLYISNPIAIRMGLRRLMCRPTYSCTVFHFSAFSGPAAGAARPAAAGRGRPRRARLGARKIFVCGVVPPCSSVVQLYSTLQPPAPRYIHRTIYVPWYTSSSHAHRTRTNHQRRTCCNDAAAGSRLYTTESCGEGRVYCCVMCGCSQCADGQGGDTVTDLTPRRPRQRAAWCVQRP